MAARSPQLAERSGHFLPAKPFSSILGLPKWTPNQEGSTPVQEMSLFDPAKMGQF
jgi:hypothetical protein